ncbi:MAG TPA: hypothetical protein VD973_13665 [Symbiobacteriaceae bacterium]|nr:hypothetical protein [Symbiobacteriaceae bacterium]
MAVVMGGAVGSGGVGGGVGGGDSAGPVTVATSTRGTAAPGELITVPVTV